MRISEDGEGRQAPSGWKKMSAKIGNVIYWLSCGLSAIALLFSIMLAFPLVFPDETDQVAVNEVSAELESLPRRKWRKVGQDKILVDGLGIVKIEGDAPNEAEQHTILKRLHDEKIKQAKRKQEHDRKESYIFIIIFMSIAAVTWLSGMVIRHFLGDKGAAPKR
jgi:hypothetical protein